MNALVEWLFEFRVASRSGAPIKRREMEEFLEAASAQWEEENDIFVGFGLDSLADEQATWLCRFPVCANHEEQLVPESKCQELLGLYQEHCDRRCWTLEDGFREFTEEDAKSFQDFLDSLEP